MTRMRYLLPAAIAALAMNPMTRALAVEGGMSPFPKGFVGFMSGLVPAAPGFYFGNDYYHFHGSVDKSVQGGVAQFGAGVTFDADFLTGTYVTDLRWLGATYAFGGAIAYAWEGLHATINAPDSGVDVELHQSGFGDSMIQPLILGWNEGNWHYNFNFSVYAPTGAYDKGELNVGKNIWAFMPQFAFSWFSPQSGWELSSAFTFVTQTLNGATQYQSGDIFQWDWAAAWHFGSRKAWAVGLQGNMVTQITGDGGAGAILGPLKAESAGFGPAIDYNTVFGQTPVSFGAKFENDFTHRNTFGGDVAMVTVAAKF